MPRRPAHHRVKAHQVYTPAEAAQTVGVHRQTVGRWIGRGGLAADTSRRPHLIRGGDLKAFLAGRREAARTTLKPGEIYCLCCRRPRAPDGGLADYRPRTPVSGLLIGLCPNCGGAMHRIVRRADIDRLTPGLDVAFR